MPEDIFWAYIEPDLSNLMQEIFISSRENIFNDILKLGKFSKQNAYDFVLEQLDAASHSELPEILDFIEKCGISKDEFEGGMSRFDMDASRALLQWSYDIRRLYGFSLAFGALAQLSVVQMVMKWYKFGVYGAYKEENKNDIISEMQSILINKEYISAISDYFFKNIPLSAKFERLKERENWLVKQIYGDKLSNFASHNKRLIDIVKKVSDTDSGLFGNICEDLGGSVKNGVGEHSGLTLMAYAYARRVVTAILCMQNYWSKEQYEYTKTIFESIQLKTCQSVWFQQHAYFQAWELIKSYDDRITRGGLSFATKMMEGGSLRKIDWPDRFITDEEIIEMIM